MTPFYVLLAPVFTRAPASHTDDILGKVCEPRDCFPTCGEEGELVTLKPHKLTLNKWHKDTETYETVGSLQSHVVQESKFSIFLHGAPATRPLMWRHARGAAAFGIADRTAAQCALSPHTAYRARRRTSGAPQRAP